MVTRSILRPVLRPMPLLLMDDDGPSPAFSANFMSGVLPAGLTYTNSSTTRTYFGSDGLLKTAAANEAIFEYDLVTRVLLGMRWEMEQRTNLALWNRDLTNAAWTSTNGTAAKNQAGIDGVANSASSFTATAGNATCLQSITSASAARVTSFFLKRITGTGTVNITQDNGTTWTAATLTSAWQRFQVTDTRANPVIGVRVVTSGDAVAVDYVQHESGATAASSPIPTTTAAVTRQPDVLTATSISPWYRKDEGTVLFEGIQTDATITRGMYCFSDGTSSNRAFTSINAGAGASQSWLVTAGSVEWTSSNLVMPAISSRFRHAYTYKLNDLAAVVNGGTVATDNTATMATLTQIRFGGITAVGANPFMGYARRFQYFNTRLPDAQIQGMSRV